MMRLIGLGAALAGLSAACGTRAHAPPPLELARNDSTRSTFPQRAATGPLTAVERDSLLHALAAHRAAWRARNVSHYRMLVAFGCFCPLPQNPAILEVQNGVVTRLFDTTGKEVGRPPLREPWPGYTVDGLFDIVEQGARRDDVIEVGYDASYDYPAMIRGDLRVGLPDDWFWIKASRLTPLP